MHQAQIDAANLASQIPVIGDAGQHRVGHRKRSQQPVRVEPATYLRCSTSATECIPLGPSSPPMRTPGGLLT